MAQIEADRRVECQIKQDQDHDTHWSFRDICSICGERIKFRNETATTLDGRRAHAVCAGMEGMIASCPMCFMIKDNCSC